MATSVLEPIPALARAAAGVGSIAVQEDSDGSLRRYALLLRHGNDPYPSLAQLLAGVAAGNDDAQVSVRGDGSMLINYGSLSPASVLRVSFSDVLRYEPEDARRLFADKIVVVGATYTGGVDYGPTPLDPLSPRAFAQIYTVNTLLTGRQLREVPSAFPYLLALLIVGLLTTQIPARHPLQLMGMAAALVGVLLSGTLVLLFAGGVVLPPVFPVLATGIAASGYGLEQWWAANAHLKERNEELSETLANLKQTRSVKERMEAELNIARDIQFSMLPQQFPPFPERTEFSLHATLVPARAVGGDFYDFFLLDPGHLYVCVADVSDKGVPAALFMAVSKAILKSHAGREPSPAAILTRANAELAQDNDLALFVTVWLGILDVATGELIFANAGHNPPYVWTSDRRLVRVAPRHGPVVGALEEVEYGEGEVHLSPGDTILLYTDRVPEAMDPEGQLYGDARLEDSVRAAPGSSVEDLVEVVAEGVWSFQGSASQADDLTVLALQFHGDS